MGAVALIVIEVVMLVELDAVEEALHVLQRVDRDAHFPDLPLGHRVVRVVADLRGEVERDG
jgi:hypothetical protein